MTTQSDRQKRIMEHLARSSNNFSNSSVNTSERQQRILEHVRLTKG